GCGGDDAKPQAKDPRNPPFKTRVNITKDGYRPSHVKILLGGQITFVNLDKAAAHTAETDGSTESEVTDSNEFDTHTLNWEEPYTVTFHKPGMIDFHSSFDSEMKGTVEVLAKR
ncbi:unnamed protein product, partial [marine sediment metagenome]